MMRCAKGVGGPEVVARNHMCIYAGKGRAGILTSPAEEPLLSLTSSANELYLAKGHRWQLITVTQINLFRETVHHF